MARLDELSPSGVVEYRSLVARCIICFIAVLVRFICKLWGGNKTQVGWDDFWILLGLCCNYVHAALTIWGIVRIAGPLSIPQLLRAGKKDQVQDYLFAVLVGANFWCLCIMCTCIGIIVFYNRIFDVARSFRRNAWILIGATSLWGVASVLWNTLICNPPSNFWRMVSTDKCGNYQTFLLVTSILEVLISVAILAMPIRPILKLSLDLHTRLSILGIFFLGGFVVLSGILRIALVYDPSVSSPDYHLLRLWGDIHIICATICACLPIYRPVWVPLVNTSRALYGYTRYLITSRSRSGVELSDIGRPSNSQGRGSGSSSNLVRQGIMPTKDANEQRLETYERPNTDAPYHGKTR